MTNFLWKYLSYITRPYTLYWTAAATVVAAKVSSDKAKKASEQASAVQAGTAASAEAEQRRQFDLSQAQAAPTRERGELAAQQQAALLGLSGAPSQQRALDAFRQSPGQAFLQQRGQQALLRSSAAIGGLGGGNVRTALQQQGIGFAQQDLQNQLSRLGGIAGQGQVATQNVAQLGAQTAGNIGNLIQASGQAQAGGILGAGAAQSRFAQQAGGAIAGSFASQPQQVTQLGRF